MSASQPSAAREVLQRLQAWVDRGQGEAAEPVPDMEALAARVAERQEILDQVQALDISTLSAADRGALKANLQALQRETEAAVAQLSERFAQLHESKVQLVTARGAMRGYKPEMRRKSRTVNRAV